MGKFIERVIELAKENVASGGRPFACVIVKNNEIIAEAVNEYEKGDPTAHAELIAIMKVIDSKRADYLKDSTFYLLCHPCPMCLTAIIYCNPSKVVFASEREMFAEYFKAGYKHATYSSLYDEISKNWQERQLPMFYEPHSEVMEVIKTWQHLSKSKNKVSEKTIRIKPDLTNAYDSELFMQKNQCPLFQYKDKKDHPKYKPFFANKILSTEPIELINYLTKTKENFEELRFATKSVNKMMKENYEKIIHQVGRSIFPLIIALENETDYEGIGSSYILFLADGSMHRIAPSLTTLYEIHKNISHIPLCIFTIISPYFFNDKLHDWVPQLENLKHKIKDIISICQISNLRNDIHNRYINILTNTLNFISSSLLNKKISYHDYIAYTQAIYDDIRINLSLAISEQVTSSVKALNKWKQELGPEVWSKLYAVIPSVWTVSKDNPRQLVLEQVMDKEKICTNLIVTEGATDIQTAKTLLGRIITDRAAAHLIFGKNSDESKLLLLALSSQTDIAALDAKKSLKGLEQVHSMPKAKL